MTTKTIDRYATDELADLFADRYAQRVAPIASYVGAMYGDEPLSTGQTEFVIRVVAHSVQYSAYDQEIVRVRAARAALAICMAYITGDRTLAKNEIGFIVIFERHAQALMSVIGRHTVDNVLAS